MGELDSYMKRISLTTVYENQDNDPEVKKVLKVSAAKVSGDANTILSGFKVECSE